MTESLRRFSDPTVGVDFTPPGDLKCGRGEAAAVDFTGLRKRFQLPLPSPHTGTAGLGPGIRRVQHGRAQSTSRLQEARRTEGLYTLGCKAVAAPWAIQERSREMGQNLAEQDSLPRPGQAGHQRGGGVHCDIGGDPTSWSGASTAWRNRGWHI